MRADIWHERDESKKRRGGAALQNVAATSTRQSRVRFGVRRCSGAFGLLGDESISPVVETSAMQWRFERR